MRKMAVEINVKEVYHLSRLIHPVIIRKTMSMDEIDL
jgi:hypothetical protein